MVASCGDDLLVSSSSSVAERDPILLMGHSAMRKAAMYEVSLEETGV